MTSIAVTFFSKSRKFGSNPGFTLIELIASLVLLGILATVFGLGIAGALNIYAISEENVHLAQKGQNAMARINREFSELTEVIERDDDDPFIVYGNLRGTGVHAIRYDGANQRLLLYSDLPDDTATLDPEGAPSDILVDQVVGFAITYLQGSESWPAGGNPRLLSHIKTRLTLSRNRGLVTHDETFTGLAYLRNTLNYGGAAPATEPPRPPALDAYGCFIESTADNRHSMFSIPAIVVILMMLAAAECLMTVIHRKNRKSESGSALIAVIAALLIFSTIAAALLPLVSSSGQQVVARDRAVKAYLLAESGFRYAAGKYIHAAGDAEKVQTLEALHDTHYQTSRGRFELKLSPYFYKVKEDIPSNVQSILTEIPGALPSEVQDIAFRDNLGLEITTGNEVLRVDRIDVTVDGDVTFELSEPTTEPITSGTLVYPVASPTVGQNLTNGGSIAVPNIDMFPSRNGYIRLADRDLNYRTKDSAGSRLVGVVDLNDPGMSLNITSGDQIVLHRHVQLTSTGFYGSGEVEASRTVTYDTPLYFNSLTASTTTYEDSFDAPDLETNWHSVWGDNKIVEQYGNRRLEVLSTDERAIGTQDMSLISLDSDEADQALRSSYARSGNYLSYDVQVKVGFDTDPGGISNPDDENFYFASGLLFRLNVIKYRTYDSYGVSILRGGEGPVDNIKSGIVPEATHDKIALVLWRQTDYATDNSWLAYKDIETAGWPVQDATLLVRIKEAKVLSFYNGGEIPIQKGNVVVGDTSGARGRVIQGPVLSNTSAWTSGTRGYVLLNSNAGAFLGNESLRVAGKGILAQVAAFDNIRANIIRVYFGRSQNCENDADNATESPRDSTVLCYPVGTSPLLWPPDLENDGSMTWPKEDDYFQLVQWDEVNGAEVIASHEDLEPNAIVVHHEDALQTDAGGDFGDRAEIGLHAFGKGAANVYFDDFGLQLISQSTSVIPTPLQQ